MCKCEYCGIEHDGTYGSGRFCSESCSRKFSASHTTYKKIIKKCKFCGSPVKVDLRVGDKYVVCQSCKNKGPKKKCRICGEEYYKKQGGCQNDFCKKHSILQLKTLIKYFGFDKSKLGTKEVEKEFLRIKDLLYKDYWTDELSPIKISKKYNYPSPCNITGKIFKYLNIPARSIHEANKLTHLNTEIFRKASNYYKYGWYTTWNGKEVYLRSSYEFDFAKELDSIKENYEVESLRIKYWDSSKNEYRCAIPDFYLPETNTIVEIKSDWTLDIQEMKDKKKAYLEQGYNFKLILEHKEVKI